MAHSFNKIWIHAIWSTKDWKPLIHADIERKVFDHIRGQLMEMGCFVSSINGMPDHVHCLFTLNPQKSVAEVMKQVKGSTSHFINQNELTPERFAWQTGYGAFSVSESVVVKVHEYIANQKQHHEKRTFQQEYEEFLKLYGFTQDGKGVKERNG